MIQGAKKVPSGTVGRGTAHRGKSLRRGLTIIEITITMSVLVLVLVGFSQALLGSMVASKTNREASLAADGARQIVERLQGSELGRAFKAYNSTTADDEGGDTLPGGFAVPGLQPRANDPDGLVGRIIFPEFQGATGIELREDLQDFSLDMPRDLTGDGVIDALDHSDLYSILPVVVRVEWRGSSGPGTFEYKTILSDF